jgi:hypothetical protein
VRAGLVQKSTLAVPEENNNMSLVFNQLARRSKNLT